jgi:HSP20 family protein
MAVIRWTPRSELWDPFNNLADLQGEMNRLFDSSLRRYTSRSSSDGGFLPACDVVEEKDHLMVQMDLPWLRREEVAVTLQEGVLSIKLPKAEAAKPKQIEVKVG